MDGKKYKLIVSDFDGTLCDDEKNVSERTLAAINGHISRGGYFALSSGRSFQSVSRIMKKLGLKGYVSCFNGALVADAESGEIVYAKTFTVEQGVFVLETLEKLGAYAQCYEPERYFASERTEYLELYEKFTDTKAIVPKEKLSVYLAKNKLRVNKILSMASENERDETIENLRKLLGKGFFITSGGKHLVEICVEGCSKGTSLNFIANRYGLTKKDVLAVGDSLNDLDMIAAAGLGLAVKNAEKTLLETAKVYPFTNCESAVGRIIEEYGL